MASSQPLQLLPTTGPPPPRTWGARDCSIGGGRESSRLQSPRLLVDPALARLGPTQRPLLASWPGLESTRRQTTEQSCAVLCAAEQPQLIERSPLEAGPREETVGVPWVGRRAVLAGVLGSVVAMENAFTGASSTALAASGSEGGAKAAVVREAVRAVLTPAKCPGLLRLAFHDAGTFDPASGTGGSNGSIIFELGRPENDGLKRYVKFLGKVREDLAKQSISVSWADIIAIGGAVAVEMCGGPHIPVRAGRLDSGKPDPEGRMPSETFNATQVIESFASKGYSLQETVCLLGAHTLGGKGFGDATKFDNTYFSILLQRPWLDSSNSMAYMIGLPSDKAIVESDDARKWIEAYAADEQRFFRDFQAAYPKMVDSGAKWEA